MRRRAFIAVFGTAALAGRAALAQHQDGKLPTIGFLGPASAAIARERTAAFERRLRELGWQDRRSIAVEYRWAEGRAERFGQIADEFVRNNVDLIVTWGTETALAVKHATAAIPIVFTIVGDPVGSGLVTSLARPGGNVTGLSTQHAEAAGKRLELLREMLPDLRLLAIMTNAENSGGLLEMQQAETAARRSMVDTRSLLVRRGEDIPGAIEAAAKAGAQALYVVGDAIFNTNRVRVNTLTLAARLPTMHGFREIVAAGGLISYGPDYLDLFARTADYVDKILRGSSPRDIPVEQPTKFELVINLTTAKALNLTLSPQLLARADEVIE